MKQSKYTNHKVVVKHYSVSLNKSEKDFDLGEIKKWIEYFCSSSVIQHDTKSVIMFKFKNIDDAFKFKLYWARA